MVLGMTYYQICMYFLIYSFLGWVVEVVYHAVCMGKVINRGFLNGPVCPVYGFGMLAVFAVTAAVPQIGGSGYSVLALFFVGMLLATVVELIAGALLDVLFHARWWDYSGKPLNFKGYICLQFSILWGIATVLVVRVLHPILSGVSVEMIPENVGWPVMGVLYLIYFGDLVLTVTVVIGLNKKLTALDRIRVALRSPSNAMSEVIGENAIKTSQKVEEGKVQAVLATAEIRDGVEKKLEDASQVLARSRVEAAKKQELAEDVLSTKLEVAGNVYTAKAEAVGDRLAESSRELQAGAERLVAELMKHPAFGAVRLLKAFPDMKHRDYREAVEYLRKKFDKSM